MKSVLFTHLIQEMDKYDDKFCKDEYAQLAFINNFVHALEILKAHTHLSEKTMTPEQIIEFFKDKCSMDFKFTLTSIDKMMEYFPEELRLEVRPNDDGLPGWGIGVIKTKGTLQ